MLQIHVPVFPITEKTTLDEIPDLWTEGMDAVKRREPMSPSLLLYEIVDEPDWPQMELVSSPAPERMLAVAIGRRTCETFFTALRQVEQREAGGRALKTLSLDLKPKTPLKRLYRQMAEAPITVFSLTLPINIGMSVFFIRSAFTISELQKELPKVVIG